MKTYIVYHGSISLQGARNVEVLLTELLKDSTYTATIYLCSNGGDVTAGVGMYNFIKSIPINVDTHCFGVCDSVAVTVFLAGKKRTAEPGSRFCLHAATFSEGKRKGKISENSTELISYPFKKELNWSDETIHKHFGYEENYFSAKEAQDWGIVQDISPMNFSSDDKIICVNLNCP